MTRRIVAEFDDGSQVLVTEWDTGTLEVARRAHSGAIWGPPSLHVRVEEDELGGDAA